MDFGRVACRCLKGGVLGQRWIPGVSHKDGREGGVDYGSVAYSGEEGGRFWKDG